FLEKRHERVRDRDRVRMPTLRGLAVVRAADGDRALVELDVPLAKAEQLALAQAGIDGGREDAPPSARNRGQEERHLVGAQGDVRALRLRALLDIIERIRPAPKALSTRASEDRVEHAAQGVDI